MRRSCQIHCLKPGPGLGFLFVEASLKKKKKFVAVCYSKVQLKWGCTLTEMRGGHGEIGGHQKSCDQILNQSEPLGD